MSLLKRSRKSLKIGISDRLLDITKELGDKNT